MALIAWANIVRIKAAFAGLIAALMLVSCNESTRGTDTSSRDNLERAYRISDILSGQANNFAGNDRNVGGALTMLDYQGRTAAEVTLTKAMEGHPDDWFRAGEVNRAQRFEYGEPQNSASRVGSQRWYTLTFWLPQGFRSDTTTHLFDLKEVRDRQTFGPLMSLSVRDDGSGSTMKIQHRFGGVYDCVIGLDTNGTENAYCDWDDSNILLGNIQNYTGRWVTVVARAVWDDGDNGAFDFWLDGRKVMGFTGNTSHQADAMRFKFGLYRLNVSRSSVNRMTVYYSNVGTGSTCERAGIADCGRFTGQIGPTGYTDIMRSFVFQARDKTEFLARGGSVVQ